MEKETLNANGIVDWQYYGDSFDLATLFIGNGFSINLCSRLSYRSLFENFSTKTSPQLKSVFLKFDTTNFELILENLNITKTINDQFKKDSSYIDPIIEELKSGLINVIVSTHPTYREISPEIFRSLGKEFSKFGNIYTTNYDVFLYKIILAYNEVLDQKADTGIRYKDNFSDEIDTDKLGLNEFEDGSKDIYYLHGSLFLFHNNYTYKYKRGTQSDEYITLLRREIQHNNFPLFVAEGHYNDKLNAIRNNYYLRSCLENLKRESNDIVIYGSALQSSDQHIVDAINSSNISNIIISVYVGSKSSLDLQSETSRFTNLFPNKSVYFYNSESLFRFHPFYKF